MASKLAILAAGLLAIGATLGAAPAAAQENPGNQTSEPQPDNGGGASPTTTVTIVGNEKTASNEMGWTRLPNQVEMLEHCTSVVTTTHFDTLLEDRHSAFFMWQVIWNTYPFTVSNVNLTTGGRALPLYQQGEEGSTAYKLVVLKRDMPPAGTDIQLTFDVCSDVRGPMEVGTIVMVFDETWTKIQLRGGIPAEIYNSAKLLVMSGEAPPDSGSGKLFVPTPTTTVAAFAMLGAGLLAGRRLRANR